MLQPSSVTEDARSALKAARRLYDMMGMEEVNRRMEKTIHTGSTVFVYPGSAPLSMTPDGLKSLEAVDHIAMRKDDGYPFLLQFTRKDDETPVCYAWSRSMECYIFPVAAPLEVYDGTIVEAELVAEDEMEEEDDEDAEEMKQPESRLAIFAVHWLAGNNLRKWKMVERHTAGEDLFLDYESRGWGRSFASSNRSKIVSMQESVVLHIKEMYPANSFMEIMAENKGKHCDGVILTPDVDSESIRRRIVPELKIKFVDTIDLQITYLARANAKPQVSLKYKNGDIMSDMFCHFTYGERDVWVKLHSNTPMMKRWKKKRRGLKINQMATDVVECRVSLNTLSSEDADKIKEREKKALETYKAAGMLEGDSTVPRDYKLRLDVWPIIARPDKREPNRLHTIVSTLAQSALISHEKIHEAMMTKMARSEITKT